MFKPSRLRRWVRDLIHFWSGERSERSGGDRRPGFRPESLESRVVPSNWTVTNTNSAETGSLFSAVQHADTDTSPAIISFDPTVLNTRPLRSRPA